MYLCGPGKHNCQPFCGPEGRFYCSDSVCYLTVRVLSPLTPWRIQDCLLPVARAVLLSTREREDFAGVLKTVCGWTNKNWLLPYACCGLHFIDSAACVLSFDHSTPLHIYIYIYIYIYISLSNLPLSPPPYPIPLLLPVPNKPYGFCGR